jgi:hypothetical protein
LDAARLADKALKAPGAARLISCETRKAPLFRGVLACRPGRSIGHRDGLYPVFRLPGGPPE